MKILLIGMCGSGKTWVMKQLIQYYVLSHTKKYGKVYYHTDNKIMVLGKYDGSTYEGTDKLSMSVMTDVEAFVTYAGSNIIVAEGDRFMNKNFIEYSKPIIIKITNDGAVGRRLRNSNQTERHLKSIQTRVNNIRATINVHNSNNALIEIKKLIDEHNGK